jgi:hypothetical protein
MGIFAVMSAGEKNRQNPPQSAVGFFGDKEVGRVGFEPTTNALKGRCSTIELPTPA